MGIFSSSKRDFYIDGRARTLIPCNWSSCIDVLGALVRWVCKLEHQNKVLAKRIEDLTALQEASKYQNIHEYITRCNAHHLVLSTVSDLEFKVILELLYNTFDYVRFNCYKPRYGKPYDIPMDRNICLGKIVEDLEKLTSKD